MSKAELEYYHWFEQEYANCINFQNLQSLLESKKIGPQIRSSAKKLKYKFSSIWRYDVLFTMRYYTVFRKTDYAVTMFKIFRPGTNSIAGVSNMQFQTIYATLYSFRDDASQNTYQHDMVSVCPTFSSADGEFRHRFITVSQFLHYFQNPETSAEIALIEQYLLKQIKKRELELTSETVYPSEHSESDQSALLESINRTRFPIKFLVIAWMLDYVRYAKGFIENHVTKGYKESMFSNTDKSFYETNKAAVDKCYEKAFNFARYFKSAESPFSPLELGQKIIPLTVKQVENMGDPQYSIWMELAMTAHLSTLVINGIAPGFPLLNDWFLIPGNIPGMYNNPVMHMRLHHSDIAKSIVKDLEQARKNTYILDPESRRELFISYNMEGLSHSIEMPMDYAEDEIIMSNYTLCYVSEYVGRTMADQPALIRNSKVHSNSTGPIFTDKKWLDKYVFEYLYNLYAMNLHLGVIHGDLHLNNITLFAKRFTVNPETGEFVIPNPRIIYNVHGELYAFLTTGITSCVIDFSRCIVSSTNPITKQSNKKILAEHKRRIMKIYEREFPEFCAAHGADLMAALHTKYDMVFKLLTALDSRKLATGLLSLLGKMPEAGEDVYSLLNKIKKMSEQYLTVGMEQLFKGTFADLDQIQWPMLDMISRLFDDYKIEKLPDQSFTLVDYFCIDNTIRYSTTEYDKLPPNLLPESIAKYKVTENIKGMGNYKRYLKHKFRQEKNINLVQDTEKNNKSARRGSPVDYGEEHVKSSASFNEFYYDT
jgi:hypothetical protein